MEQETQTPHKRRVRYKGKYPRKFEEKYKELNPEKYKDTIEHVISKGNTPAGMHISIMVNEILDFLKIQPGETGFDATLGYGGHTKAMMECLHGEGHMYATDVDPEESAKTRKRLAEQGFGEDILTVKLQNFCTIDEIAKEAGGFDFILADLGVSSMQIDNPKRGFSFRADGPLDLRLNQEKGISAAERLDKISRDELAGMLYENSDEPYCEEIAKAITDEIRKGNRVDTTTKLREIIEETLDFLPEKEKKDTVRKTCQRVFQALRIDVNREFEVLYDLFLTTPEDVIPSDVTVVHPTGIYVYCINPKLNVKRAEAGLNELLKANKLDPNLKIVTSRSTFDKRIHSLKPASEYEDDGTVEYGVRVIKGLSM